MTSVRLRNVKNQASFSLFQCLCAGWWFIIAGCLCLAPGCMLYPDIEAEPDKPNYPPEILVNTLEPQDNGFFQVDLDCQKLIFKVGQVSERNHEDSLYVGWYLNWQRENHLQPDWGWWTLPGYHDNPRPGPELSLPLYLLEENKMYALRVFVADRFPNIPEDPNTTILDFPDNSNGGFDTYQWTFQAARGSGFCNPGEMP